MGGLHVSSMFADQVTITSLRHGLGTVDYHVWYIMGQTTLSHGQGIPLSYQSSHMPGGVYYGTYNTISC
jgi:hypothetical protein